MIDTFKRNGQYRDEFRSVEATLQTKTLIFHLITSVSRILYSIAGQSYWQKGLKGRANLTYVNQDFVDGIEQYLTYAIIALIPVGLLIDIIAWRWRNFANFIIYYEAISMLLQSFVPFDYGNFDLLFSYYTYIHMYVIGVCKTGQSIFACFFSICI